MLAVRGPAGTGPADGTYPARVAECSACWRRRAQAIQRSRDHLRAMGLLAGSQPCGVTWMGADVGHEELDPLENAIASDLLRAGIAVPAPSGDVVLRVVAGRVEVAPALELQPA